MPIAQLKLSVFHDRKLTVHNSLAYEVADEETALNEVLTSVLDDILYPQYDPNLEIEDYLKGKDKNFFVNLIPSFQQVASMLYTDYPLTMETYNHNVLIETFDGYLNLNCKYYRDLLIYSPEDIPIWLLHQYPQVLARIEENKSEFIDSFIHGLGINLNQELYLDENCDLTFSINLLNIL